MEWDGINRRRSVRKKFPYTVHIYTKEKEPISTYTEDISCDGIRVVIRTKLNRDDEVGLKIYLSNNSVECKGRVVWVKEKFNPMLEDTFFETGIEFKDILKEAQRCINSDIESIKKE